VEEKLEELSKKMAELKVKNPNKFYYVKGILEATEGGLNETGEIEN
jgi:hypothetical protein